jgi:hypothetical protein
LSVYSEVAIVINPNQLKKDMFLHNPLVPLDWEIADMWDKGAATLSRSYVKELWLYHQEEFTWYEGMPSYDAIIPYLETLEQDTFYLISIDENNEIITDGSLEVDFLSVKSSLYFG